MEAPSPHGPPDPGREVVSVANVMRREYVVVSADEPLEEALCIMKLARLRHLLVEDDGILVGILSYRDIQDRALARHGATVEEAKPDGADAMAVEDAMTRSPHVMTADASLAAAASRICHLNIGCLPVVESTPRGPRLLGVVTESDLLRAAYPVS